MTWVFFKAKDEKEADSVAELIDYLMDHGTDIDTLLAALKDDMNQWDDVLEERYRDYQQRKTEPGYIIDDDDFSKLEAKARQ